MHQKNRKQKILDKKRKENAIKDNLHEERAMWKKKREYCARTSQQNDKFCKIPVYVRTKITPATTAMKATSSNMESMPQFFSMRASYQPQTCSGSNTVSVSARNRSIVYFSLRCKYTVCANQLKKKKKEGKEGKLADRKESSCQFITD